MIIIHENLPREAERVALRVKEVFGFDNEIISKDLTGAFVPAPNTNGFYSPSNRIQEILSEPKKKILIVTSKDLYASGDGKNLDWILGYNWRNIHLTSTARMKGFNNELVATPKVSRERYVLGVETAVLHEIGHSLIQAQHFREASKVINPAGYELALGAHCDDKTCVMHESIDLDILRPDLLCGRCKSSIKSGDSYI